MNVKILTGGVFCLLGGDYEKAFIKLKKLTGDCQGMFTERRAGANYLEWDLPGDGWKRLSECDPGNVAEVKHQLDERRQQVRQLFGENTKFADNVLTVPSEDHIFYRYEPDGKLSIALTAWGYRHPETIDSRAGDGKLKPKPEKGKVQIAFDWDGKHLPLVPFKLQDQLQSTNNDGVFDIKNPQEVGKVIPIEVAGKELSLTVNNEQQLYSFDLTKYFNIELIVTRDGKPAANTTCKVTFGTKTIDVITNDNGSATHKLAFAPDNGKVAQAQPECVVKCEDQSQSLIPSIENDKLQFVLKLVTKMLNIEVAVTRDGKPESNTPVEVEYGGDTITLTTDENGIASKTMPFVRDQQGRVVQPQPECVAKCEDLSQSLTPNINSDKLHFDLQLVTKMFNVEVAVTRDGMPESNTPVKVEYGGDTITLTTDENGIASKMMPFVRDQQGRVVQPQPECVAKCEDLSQSLTPNINSDKLHFDLNIVTPVIEPKFLTLSFLDCKGKPMPELEIHVTNKSGKQLIGTTDKDGKVSFPREDFQNGEKPKIKFVISKEYQEKTPGAYR